MAPVDMGMVLPVSRSCDHFLVDGNCTPIVPVVGNSFTVVRVIIRFAGDVYTKLGLNVKLQIDRAGVIVTVFPDPAVAV